MATSDVEIANRALQWLGARRISSLTQDHKNARAVNACFVPLRERLLRKYNWSFAIKRASVGVDENSTTFGSFNRFALPTDYVRLMRNKEIDFLDSRHDWTIEGQYIVTMDGAPLQFRYIAKITTPTEFDATFAEAFSLLISLATCDEVTGSNTKRDFLNSQYREVISEARINQAIEKGMQETVQDTWLDSLL